MARKVIKSMTLREISSVDRPAQVGATCPIFKRADAPPSPEPTIMKTRAELEAAITKFQAQGGTNADIVAIKKAAGELQLESILPSEGALAKSAAPATDPAVTARLEKAERIAALTAVEKAHYDALNDADKVTFLAKDAGARTEAISKSKGDDPVVYTTLTGIDIRKSADPLILSLAKQADESERNLAKANARAGEVELEKRAAGDDFKFLKGDVNAKKALIKAVDGISDEATRTAVGELLKGANTAMSGAFTKRGSTDPGAPPSQMTDITKRDDADNKLEELAKAHMGTHKVDFAKAYAAVIETEEGRALYAVSTGTAS